MRTSKLFSKKKSLTKIIFLCFSLVLVLQLTSALSISSVHLNATSSTNESTDNLTTYVEFSPTANAKLIYQWKNETVPNNILYVPFEEGSTASSTTNYGKTSSVNSPTSSASYVVSGGFDGFGYYNFLGLGTDFLTVDLEESKFMANGSYTYSFWINPNAGSANEDTILSDGTASSGFNINFLNATWLTLRNSNTNTDVIDVGPVTSGAWNHILITFDNGSVSSYIDNVAIDSGSSTFTDSSGNLSIGFGLEYNEGFFGYIDEVQIFNLVASSQKRNFLYNNQSSILLAEETSLRDKWQVCATAVNSSSSSSQVCSQNLSFIPRITLNAPANYENLSMLQANLSVSTDKTTNISYSLNGASNITLCTDCTLDAQTINYSDFGQQLLTIYANESGTSKMTVNDYVYYVFQDTDLDGINDTFDLDADGDGINDTEDSLNGNLSNVLSNVPSLNLSIGGSTNASQNFSGILTVNFTSNGTSFLEFDYNFSSNQTLDLAKVKIEKQNDSASIGGAFISGINLTGNQTKTIYIDKVDVSKEALCIKDTDAKSITNITSDCSGIDEIKIACPGTNGTYTCTDLGNQFQISGLSNSLVIQTFNFPSSGGGSSSSGGGGSGGSSSGSSSGGGSSSSCSTQWVCEEWSNCENDFQTRSCEKLSPQCEAGLKPMTLRSCSDQNTFQDLEFTLADYTLETVRDITVRVDFSEVSEARGPINLLFRILDEEGTSLYVFEEKSLPTQLEVFEKTLFTKEDLFESLDAGTYSISLVISSGEETYEALQQFQIIELSGLDLFRLDFLVIAIIILIAILWRHHIKKR